MEKLDITNKLVADLVAQVVPVVEQETGWSLYWQGINLQVLPKNRGYEDIIQGRLRHLGIAVNESPLSTAEQMIEIVMESNILAAYEPGDSTLFVVRENVDESNIQGLMVLLAHELVHRGQHLNHPELFTRVDRIVRQLYQNLATEQLDRQQVNAQMESIQSIMTLIESHAMYVQQQIQRKYYPNALIESHYNFLTVLGSVYIGRKARQYTDGLAQVAQAAASGQMADLFTSAIRSTP